VATCGRLARAHRQEWPRAIDDARQNVEEDLTTTRSLPRLLTLGAALVFAVTACSQTGTGGSAAPGGAGGPVWTPDPTLLAAAKTEGALNTIALPHDWCNYGDQLKNFKAATGLTINENAPNAGSGTEVDAIKNTQSSGGPTAPDVIEFGYSFGDSTKEAGLLQPYKVKNWDVIPASVKDPDGIYYGNYYGVLAF